MSKDKKEIKKPKPPRNIYVVGGDIGYANWMEADKIVDRMEDATLVVFTGGADVDPSYYGHPKHPATFSDPDRDAREKMEYMKAKGMNLPCIGICRGSQFLCVMNGGALVQHQPNPTFMHSMKTVHGHDIYVTSTHHQAARPRRESKHYLVGWTGFLDFHQDGDGNEFDLFHGRECEIVYYHKLKDLGIQSHPEMVFDKYKRNQHITEYIDYCRMLLNTFLDGSLYTNYFEGNDG